MGGHTLDNKQKQHLARMICRVRLRLCSGSLCGFEYYDDTDVLEAFGVVERHVARTSPKDFLYEIEKEAGL